MDANGELIVKENQNWLRNIINNRLRLWIFEFTEFSSFDEFAVYIFKDDDYKRLNNWSLWEWMFFQQFSGNLKFKKCIANINFC